MVLKVVGRHADLRSVESSDSSSGLARRVVIVGVLAVATGYCAVRFGRVRTMDPAGVRVQPGDRDGRCFVDRGDRGGRDRRSARRRRDRIARRDVDGGIGDAARPRTHDTGSVVRVNRGVPDVLVPFDADRDRCRRPAPRTTLGIRALGLPPLAGLDAPGDARGVRGRIGHRVRTGPYRRVGPGRSRHDRPDGGFGARSALARGAAR